MASSPPRLTLTTTTTTTSPSTSASPHRSILTANAVGSPERHDARRHPVKESPGTWSPRISLGASIEAVSQPWISTRRDRPRRVFSSVTAARDVSFQKRRGAHYAAAAAERRVSSPETDARFPRRSDTPRMASDPKTKTKSTKKQTTHHHPPTHSLVTPTSTVPHPDVSPPAVSRTPFPPIHPSNYASRSRVPKPPWRPTKPLAPSPRTATPPTHTAPKKKHPHHPRRPRTARRTPSPHPATRHRSRVQRR